MIMQFLDQNVAKGLRLLAHCAPAGHPQIVVLGSMRADPPKLPFLQTRVD